MANVPPYWILLAVAMISLMLFLVSEPYAMYQGQHDFSDSKTVDCVKCHNDIQLSVNASAQSVLDAHTAAAGNNAYIAYLAVGGIDYDPATRDITAKDGKVWINPLNDSLWGTGTLRIDGNLDWDNNGISGKELCLLCHSVSMGTDVTHAATIRVCDDDRCHGNRNHVYNDADMFANLTETERAAGYLLNQTGRIHRNFYLTSSDTASKFSLNITPAFGVQPGNIIGSSISRGFNTCLGCHSTVEATATLTTGTYDHTNPSAARQRYMPTTGTFNM